MLKGKHIFNRGKQEEALAPVVPSSGAQSDAMNDSTTEDLNLSDVPPLAPEVAEVNPSTNLADDSTLISSSEDTMDPSKQTNEIQATDSVQLAEEVPTDNDPNKSAIPDIVIQPEQIVSPVFIEDESDLLSELFSLAFMSEKKPNNGEDSDPLLFLNPKFSAVGVFDGMGGAGSAIHLVGGQEKTGAYLASRKTKDSIAALLDSVCELKTSDIDSLKYDIEFKSAIVESLNNLKKECPPKMKSGLKSAMIKEFPTTLAIITLKKRHNIIILDSYWAGDSRNFLLSTKGLFQTSVDDLEKKSDPYENLYSDSPLSNQICSDRPFSINHITLEPETSRFAIISATDGCFGYYPTPMHFEEALLRNLHGANTIEEWKDSLKKEFSEIAADDTSFSCIINGFESFDAFKLEMEERFGVIHSFIEDYNVKVGELTELKQQVEEKEAGFKEYKQSEWSKYKYEYMSFLNISDNHD